MHPYLFVCFYQVFIFRPWDNRLTAHYTYQTWRCTGMCKQFFDMYLLLLFARLYYSKSHTLPLETYMSSYFVTLDMHTGYFHLFPKITVQPPQISFAFYTRRPHKNYSAVQSQLYILYIFGRIFKLFAMCLRFIIWIWVRSWENIKLFIVDFEYDWTCCICYCFLYSYEY